ncbi:class I SAM-dependent methyltransferase [Candidatus Electronema sp. PJ]|uniref:class I SAM-dependent methyltransferase n=1 Tax=Candidatus Electronema sp. PJ TaxID=3401572 RepID=UPI003AA834E4
MISAAREHARHVLKRLQASLRLLWLAYPKTVECNLCGWQGRVFLSDSWHKYIMCPVCGSNTRHRLFFAVLQHNQTLSFAALIRNKSILHFAPEWSIRSRIQQLTASYKTADFLRKNCEFKLDMSNMPEIQDGSFDTVLAFDVLEHVPNYIAALVEIRRILSPQGVAILTVPQKDHLPHTYEDPSIVAPEERTRHFGQWDHLRIFGDDFPQLVEAQGFVVTTVDATLFPLALQARHVLCPPLRSTHPLATNFRKVFFCQKQA